VNHFTQKDWQGFVTNTLMPARLKAMEDHLYECEECLADYLRMNEQINCMKVPSAPVGQIDSMLQGLGVSTQKQKMRKSLHPIWQYVIAASLTIIFMSSGLFHQVTGIWKEAESGLERKAPDSLTESLMDRTLNLIDNFQSTK
jgi:hypothetical protein